MTTLITGASGFVGRHLVERIADSVPLTRADADLARPLPTLPRAETVIHCAAEIDDVSSMDEVNVRGTERLVELAKTAGVQTFVLLSTGGVHGESPYARTKRAAEEIALGARDGMSVHIARLYFPYGPGQGSRRLVPRLIARVRAGEAVTADAEGGPVLSLTYIDDVVEALVRIAALDSSHILDVGGPAIAMRDIATTIDPNATFEIGPPATSFIADKSALRALTGFAPQITFEEGLRACV